MKKLIYLIAISLIVVACNPHKATVSTAEDQATGAETAETATDMLEGLNDTEDSLFVIIERSACFGTCPYYKMTIYTSGYTVIEGKQHVVPLGFNATVISEEKIATIKQTAYDINFFELQEVYDDKGVADLPANAITMHVDGKTHAVSNRAGGPDNFRDLVNVIHSIVAEYEWKALEEGK